MSIPTSFELFGYTYKVELDQEIWDVDENFGEMMWLQKLIKLVPWSKTIKREQVEQTFYHELVHAILSDMGKVELSRDDEFVDLFAQLLYQYEKSRKGVLKKER